MTAQPPLLAAPVSGFSAFVLAGLLDEHLPARMVQLRRLVEKGQLHPALLDEVTGMWAATREAGRQWSQHRAYSDQGSVDGSAEDVFAETARSSSEIDSRRASELLAVSPSRVRQLVRNGQLNARKAAGVWLLDRTEVELRRGATNELVRRDGKTVPVDRA